MASYKINRSVSVLLSLVIFIMMIPNTIITANADYENTHTNTGNQRDDIVAVAETQIGYHEGSLEGTTNGSNNYTKYNVDLYKINGSYNYAWCQSFVSWCAKQADISASTIPRTAGTVTAKDHFIDNGVYHAGPYEGGSYIPSAGDIIYFYSPSTKSKHHVGIVSGCDGSTVYTIEGNSGDMVTEHEYSVSYSRIRGYGVPFTTPPPKKMWYDEYSPVDLGSFYGKISNQSNGLYFTDTGSTIAGGSATDGANQIWKFEHQSDNSYKIINYSNGYPMDIAGANTVDGTDVRTWADDNGSSAQRFYIYNIWGSYYIRPLCSDLPLDMSLGTDDHNIATWGYGAEWAPQMFDIEKIDVNGFLPVGIGNNFIARIKNQSNDMYFTDTGSTIGGQAVSDSTTQLWKFEYQANGSYKIINQSNGYPMDIYSAYTDDGTDVRTWSDDNASKAQRFYIYRAYDSYYIKPLCSDKMLDMSLGTDDHNVSTWGFGADWAPQKFDIEKVDINGFVPVNIGDSFLATIKNQSNGLYFTNTGSTIAGQEKADSKSQLWKFERQSNGSYKIISQLNGYPMDIAGASTDDNTDVRAWSGDNGSTAQRFYIYRAYDSYYIKPLCSDKMLDMSLGTDDHNVTTWGFGADWAPQKFDIDKVKPTTSSLTISKNNVIIGENVVFTATSDYATGYTIGIDKDNERLITKEIPNGKISLVFDKPGLYSAYVTSYNSEGYVDSKRISITVNSEITLQNGEQYTLPIENSNHTFKSHNENVAIVSKKGIVTAIGEGNAKLSIINADSDVVQITIKVIKPYISGDCNSDGDFNVSDVVLLQKWLLTIPNTHLDDWKSADLNTDGKLNGFDLALMRWLLLKTA